MLLPEVLLQRKDPIGIVFPVGRGSVLFGNYMMGIDIVHRLKVGNSDCLPP